MGEITRLIKRAMHVRRYYGKKELYHKLRERKAYGAASYTDFIRHFRLSIRELSKMRRKESSWEVLAVLIVHFGETMYREVVFSALRDCPYQPDLLLFVADKDTLSDDAMYEIKRAWREQNRPDFFYFDEDRINAEGKRYAPFLKPDFDKELFRSSGIMLQFRDRLKILQLTKIH